MKIRNILLNIMYIILEISSNKLNKAKNKVQANYYNANKSLLQKKIIIILIC